MSKYDPEKDYYEALGVAEDASDEDISRAFRARAREVHPDGGGSEEQMKALNEARDVLSDPATRSAYDEVRRRPQSQSYASSVVWEAQSETRSGGLEVPLDGGEAAGLFISAATCFLIAVPLLLLVEFQWVFFLWPLRMMLLGALVLGVGLAYSALNAYQREALARGGGFGRREYVVVRVAFWFMAVAGAVGLLTALYA